MNNILKIVLIVLGVIVLAGGLLFAGVMLGSRFGQRTFADYGPGFGMGPMGNGANMPGRMGDRAGGRGQGQGRAGGYGMMPGYGQQRNQANLTPVTTDEAKQAAQTYLTSLNLEGLEVGDIQVIGNDAHVVVKETATGIGAFELVVDAATKAAYPSGGANMMWNLKYGGVVHTNMMQLGRFGAANPNATPAATPGATTNATPAQVSADMPVTSEQAVTAAQAFLDQAAPGATASTTPLQFYGYYSLSYSKDGNVIGFLSVNGYNSQVLPDGLHGMFMHGPK